MTYDELLDHTPLAKGKYKGRTPNEVADIDPSYLVWAFKTWSPKPCSKLLYDACVEDDNDPITYDEEPGVLDPETRNKAWGDE